MRIRPGEYLVYHFWPKNLVRCAPNGDALTIHNEVGYVFDDLATAQTYCQWKVRHSKLGCLIYDHRWKIVDQAISLAYLAARQRGHIAAQRVLALDLIAVVVEVVNQHKNVACFAAGRDLLALGLQLGDQRFDLLDLGDAAQHMRQIGQRVAAAILGELALEVNQHKARLRGR